jgi:hypothetical protein
MRMSLNKKHLQGVQMIHGACVMFSRKEPPWPPEALGENHGRKKTSKK